MAWRALVVVVLAQLSLTVHELGHTVVLWSGGESAWISLERAHPVGDVPAHLQTPFLLGGPATTLLLLVSLVALYRARRSWVVRAAVVVNGTQRLFPAVVGLATALLGTGSGVSDEGNLALRLSTGQAGRIAIATTLLAIWIAAAFAATRVDSGTRNKWEILGIAAVATVVPFAAHYADQWLRWT